MINRKNEMNLHNCGIMEFNKLQQTSNAVCLVESWNGTGTGSYCVFQSKKFILTNHHVIKERNNIKAFYFKYTTFRTCSEKVDAKKDFFYSNEELDYSIIGVDENRLENELGILTHRCRDIEI